MSSGLVPNWITLIQHMAEWVYSNDFPNWSTLIVDIGIGVGLALTIFLLQSRTDRKIAAEATIEKYLPEIDKFIEFLSKVEAETKAEDATSTR